MTNEIKPLKRKLGVKEKNFISYCERFYFLEDRGFPTPEQAALALSYSVSEIHFFLQNRTVQEALESRGLNWHVAEKQSKNLSPTQVACAITVMNFADIRSNERKLSDLGVLPQQWQAWLNDPIFKSYLNSVADRNLENIRPEAITEFIKLVRQGDFQALKYYFEVTGEFSQNNQQILNLQVVIQRIIEAVQEEVKDAAILGRISQKILAAAPIAADGVQVNLDQTGRRNVLTS
jgi:hypothetical protein